MTTDHKVLKRSYREIIEVITTVINEWDPYDLISSGAPDNEFAPEVEKIVAKIHKIRTPGALAEVISGAFSKGFDSDSFSVEDCMQVSSRIFVELQNRGLFEQKPPQDC